MAAVGLTRTGALSPSLADLLSASAARTALTGRPDLEALAWLRGSGILATAVPAEYGGDGQGANAVNQVVGELAMVNPSVAIIAFQHFAVSMRIAEWGTPAQQAAILPALAAGDLLAASAWSEPGVGAAKRKVNTIAAPVPGAGWLLNGVKSFTTSAGIADIYMILAQTSDVDDPGSRYGSSGQSFFLVSADNPGVVPDHPLNLIGMRGSATGYVSLRDCRVADSGRLGPAGHAAVIIASVRESGMTLGAVSVGIAQALLGIAATHSDRQELVKQTMSRHWLADLSTQVSAAHALVSLAGQRSSADPGRTTIQSKLFASAVAEHVGAEVARMVGSAGYLADHEVNRLIADARAVAHMGPVNDLCRELLAAPPGKGQTPR